MTVPMRHEDPEVDLYQLLGLDPGASSSEISRAYRRLARWRHPDVDRTPGASQRFAEITRAYRVLSNPRARARYDLGPASRRARNGTVRVQDAWSPWTTDWVRASSTAQEAFWLGDRGPTHAFHLGSRPRPHQDEEAEVELTVEESCNGATRTVTVTSDKDTQRLHVVIPAGAIDGDRVEVPIWRPGGPTAPAVFLRVRLAAHERYRVDGRDLHVSLPLSPWEAALGASIEIAIPAGQAAIDVPAGIATGQTLTLAGRGIPNPAGPAGDLHAHAHIVVPARLTTAERDLFRQLARASTFNPRTAAAPPP